MLRLLGERAIMISLVLRLDSIAFDVDSHPRARYFQQKSRSARRSDDLSMERFPTAHQKGGRARTALLQKARTYQRLGIPIANCVDDDQVTNMTLVGEVEVLDGPILSMNPTSTKAPWLFSQGAFNKPCGDGRESTWPEPRIGDVSRCYLNV